KLTSFPNQLSKVDRCVPVYEEMPGWKCDTTKCKTYDELPENAKKYLQRMAELVDVKIGMISIGAKRDQSIVIDEGLARGMGL
ncbi:MAG: adenylosuccinate synthetase, partial [Fibrobacter sp.]|nr:adenylosuccinate synthetase [Fibrobacter sp.]